MRLVLMTMLLHCVNLIFHDQVPSVELSTPIRPLGILYGSDHLRFSDHGHILQISTQVPFFCNHVLVGFVFLILRPDPDREILGSQMLLKCQPFFNQFNIPLSNTSLCRMLCDGMGYFVLLTGTADICPLFRLADFPVSLVSNIFNIVLYRTNENTQVCLDPWMRLSVCSSYFTVSSQRGASHVGPHITQWTELCSRVSIGYVLTWIMTQRLLIHLNGMSFCAVQSYRYSELSISRCHH